MYYGKITLNKEKLCFKMHIFLLNYFDFYIYAWNFGNYVKFQYNRFKHAKLKNKIKTLFFLTQNMYTSVKHNLHSGELL